MMKSQTQFWCVGCFVLFPNSLFFKGSAPWLSFEIRKNSQTKFWWVGWLVLFSKPLFFVTRGTDWILTDDDEKSTHNFDALVASSCLQTHFSSRVPCHWSFINHFWNQEQSNEILMGLLTRPVSKFTFRPGKPSRIEKDVKSRWWKDKRYFGMLVASFCFRTYFSSGIPRCQSVREPFLKSARTVKRNSDGFVDSFCFQNHFSSS